MNNIIKKKRFPRNFIFSLCTGIRTDLPTKFLPNPNRDADHYATEHLQICGVL